MNPTGLPNLKSLYISGYPEWDIYFIMLERRLMWSSQGSVAFETLEVPGFTHRSLLRHICEILQGRLPDRPTNFELSLIGNAELLLDQTIPDCSAEDGGGTAKEN
ncbi:hypothetical protein CPB86DRAFT_810460 [Serendipita vermifera]|nr:hypothetical protein CPB86DRAFT_810460 [Serendipita vermifera]